jgi:hypothetical protein
VLVFGFVVVSLVGVALLAGLLVSVSRADRRAADRLRGPMSVPEGGPLVRTVAALRAREGADRMPMYPGGVQGRHGGVV